MDRHKIADVRGDLKSVCLIASSESGQELAEAAIVLPILFLILLAIFWFGRAFNVGSTIDRAAREGVKAAGRPTCATCGNALPSSSQVVAQVASVLSADNLYISRVKPYSPPFACIANPLPNCTPPGSNNNVQICTGVPITCGNVPCASPPTACGPSAELGVRVSFAYETPLPLTIANISVVTIHASAQSEPEF
jgi:TadE-like protein